MTTVYLHGLLGKEFGRKFKFSLGRPRDCVLAIDANKNWFLNRILELSKKGAHYSVIVDGRTSSNINLEISAKELHIMPSIAGAAGTVAAIGAVLTVAAYAGIVSSPFWTSVLIAVGTAALTYGISNLMQKDQKTDVGSASATSNALNKSFLFSSGENLTEQGNPVPIGYGRLRIGSAVIQSTIKSFPAKFDEKNSLPIYSEFTELATKRGLSQMAIIDSQQSQQTDSI
jgi:predicted phage tail protein